MLFGALLAWLVFQMSGCSLIGVGVGALADSGIPPRSMVIEWKDIRAVPPGRIVSLQFKDGHIEQGSFLGIRQVPEAEYSKLYKTAQYENGDARLPNVGEKLSVLASDGSRRDAIFSGFDLDAYGKPSFLLEFGERSGTYPAPIPLIKEIQSDNGNPLDLGKINALLSAGRVPFASRIGVVIEAPAGVSTKLISWPEIRSVEVKNKRRGWLTGLIVGGSLDAVVLISVGLWSRYHFLRSK